MAITGGESARKRGSHRGMGLTKLAGRATPRVPDTWACILFCEDGTRRPCPHLLRLSKYPLIARRRGRNDHQSVQKSESCVLKRMWCEVHVEQGGLAKLGYSLSLFCLGQPSWFLKVWALLLSRQVLYAEPQPMKS